MLQELKMGAEGFLTSFRSRISGQRLPSSKGFGYLDVVGIFQVAEMGGEVAIGDLKEFLEGSKVTGGIDHQDRHDA